MSQLLKIIVIIIGIGALLFFGYQAVTGTNTTDDALLTSGGPKTIDEVEQETEALLSRLSELQRYDVTGTIFSSAVFTSLYDFRVELVDEPTGRTNPFASMP